MSSQVIRSPRSGCLSWQNVGFSSLERHQTITLISADAWIREPSCATRCIGKRLLSIRKTNHSLMSSHASPAKLNFLPTSHLQLTRASMNSVAMYSSSSSCAVPFQKHLFGLRTGQAEGQRQKQGKLFGEYL